MISLELVSWKPGLETVYLMEAVRDYSTGSLARAKEDVGKRSIYHVLPV